MTLILQVVIGIFVLGVLVLIHELGHFLAAKSCGIRVISFSIGFGPPIFKANLGGTEYRVSAIPFGGYVHMAGEHPEDEHEKASDEFTAKPKWQRAFVAVAGPAANYLLAFLTLWFLFIWGVPREVFNRPIIGAITAESEVSSSNLHVLDSIISINGAKITSWEDIEQEFATQGQVVDVVAKRGEETIAVTLIVPETKGFADSKARATGLLPFLPALVGKVYEGYPAAETQLQSNDTILQVNDKPIRSWYEFSATVRSYDQTGGPLQILIARPDTSFVVALTPRYDEGESRYLVGIEAVRPPTQIVRYGPLGAIGPAINKSWEYTTKIFDVLAKLVNRKVSPKQLAGPVGIVQMSGIAALGGVVAILNFMALISINLAVLNLFPLIITDGGLLLFLLLEAIRGKPLSLKSQMLINRIAISLFIALFLFVTFNDVRRFPELFRYFSR